MTPKEQIEVLRRVAKVECDFEALNIENKRDFEERTIVGREVRRLEGELRGMTVQTGLPAAKLDEAEVHEKMLGATAANARAREIDQAKSALRDVAKGFEQDCERLRVFAADRSQRVESLRKEIADQEMQLIAAKENLAIATVTWEQAINTWDAAPVGELVDVSVLAAELAEIQTTNREIDKRVRREGVEELLRVAQREASDLTHAIESRDEHKAMALHDAKMPVVGLTFDEERVLFAGIPLAQLGEAEQLRVSAEIMMAGEPKLRILPIWRGEALDDDNLAMLDALAEARDFYVLMLKVDSSGSVGIVLEDGEVKSVN
jgi:hypothetical protein